jgi:NAD(P)-dependent dehydrogenase (short-subunit alcohol dehydrogenase family)
MKLEGKTALISGASRNIGREIALTFAREGADVAVLAKNNPDELEAVAEECRSIGRKALAIQCDVSDSAAVATTVATAIQTLGTIDILVSNAGIRPHKPLLEVSDEDWRAVLGVNLDATFFLIRAVLPGMIQEGSGSIMAMGGKAALTGRPDSAAVSTSKHGLLGLIRAVAAEAGPHGIRANLINPGSILVERRNPEWYKSRKHARGSDEHIEGIPLRRQGAVEDIAEACLYFASDASAYVTGNALNVMGGEYIL